MGLGIRDQGFGCQWCSGRTELFALGRCFPTLSHKFYPPPAVECMWHRNDSHGQIMAFAFRQNSLTLFEAVPSLLGASRHSPTRLNREKRTELFALGRCFPTLSHKYHPPPLSSECGTDKTVKARSWPWLSGKTPESFSLRSGVAQGQADAVRHSPTSFIPSSTLLDCSRSLTQPLNCNPKLRSES